MYLVTCLSVSACVELSVDDWESTQDLDEATGVAEQGLPDTPRISYWWGKVNAHRDSGGSWTKDADCTSGANIDPLTYCKKFYPNTTSVTPVALSAKPALLWNTAGCGQQYTSNGVNEWTCNP